MAFQKVNVLAWSLLDTAPMAEFNSNKKPPLSCSISMFITNHIELYSSLKTASLNTHRLLRMRRSKGTRESVRSSPCARPQSRYLFIYLSFFDVG